MFSVFYFELIIMLGAKKPSNKLDKYIDPTGEFPNSELKAGVWYVRNKKRIHDIGLAFFIIFDAVLALVNIYIWAEYLVVGYAADERNRALLTKNLVSSALIHNLYAAEPLAIGQVTVVASAPGKYDFFAEARNGNSDYKVELEYQFLYNGGITDRRKALIMPGSRMALTVLGVPLTYFPQGTELRILRTDWSKVDPHQIPDPVAFLSERINFKIDNFNFSPAFDSSGALTNTIVFDITNASIYSYWQADFFVVYKNGSAVVGMKKITLDKFRAGDKRNVELKSLTENILVTEADVIPAIDLFDREVYIPVGVK